MTRKPRIGLIIGSTRPSRFAETPADWMQAQAEAHGGLDVERIDLRDFNLPFFDEIASNRWMPSVSPEARRWQEVLARMDGFIFVVAEYNRSITGALKNALDQAYNEWGHKPFTAIAYGGTGGARALEHLRLMSVELQMVPTRTAVHISGPDFVAVHPAMGNRPMAEIEEHLLPSAQQALDELHWWARATMAARAEDRRAAA